MENRQSRALILHGGRSSMSIVRVAVIREVRLLTLGEIEDLIHISSIRRILREHLGMKRWLVQLTCITNERKWGNKIDKSCNGSVVKSTAKHNKLLCSLPISSQNHFTSH